MAATLEQIIKDLQEIADSGGVGGNSASRRKAAEQAKIALQNGEKLNKNNNEALKLQIKNLELSKKLYKADSEQYQRIEREIKQNDERIKQNDQIADAANKVGQSFVGLGKAAFEGQGSISAFTDNIKGLGFIGNRLDVNIETFRQLSQSGANFGKSIVDLRLAAAEAALPLDDFASLVANNSQNLAALFGSTTQGARGIAELGRITREVGIDRLAPLGFTVDEINETLLLNLDSQRRTGILNRLTDAQRRDSAISFAEQLDRLAKLTGQQRDELRAQIEQQKANERFQAALQGQTDATRQRLQAFAGTVAGISPELAEGFQDLIANAGVPVTESALALVQNIPGARAVINDLIAGVVTSEEALVRIRDISAGSIDRFRQATVTGQVEFLRLQGGIIELGRRVTNTGAVFDEQDAQVSSLVKNLTSFEQATKVLASQFQGIETSLLKSFGPALGGLINGLQVILSGAGSIATMLGKAPALTAGLITAGLAGKFLFNYATQVAIVAAGTRIGNSDMLKSLGAFRQGLTTGAGGVGRGLGVVGGAGAVLGGAAQAGTAETRGGQFMGLGTSVLGGALAGASFGKILGLPGAVVGALLGGAIGTAGLLMNDNTRQFGGGMDAGKTYLTGEAGPELITTREQSVATANRDLRETFSTEALEGKMSSMVTAMTEANKTFANVASGVNTLIAVESRALKAVETTARKDRNQIGLV